MFRFACLPLVGMVLFAFTRISTGNPPDEPNSRFEKDLQVQNAMTRAQVLLIQNDAKKAVEILEEQLPNVNGNPAYLLRLRDAYRTYVTDLSLQGQPDLAKRYFDRLCILDPNAVNDPAFRSQPEASPRKFAAEPAPKPSVVQFPSFKLPTLPNPFAKKDDPKGPPIIKPSVARATSEDEATVDPFEAKFQRTMPSEPSKGQPQSVPPRELLTKAEVEFKRERYAEARMYFEQAYQADQSSMEACRVQWAYCIIKGVSEEMDRPGVLPAKLPELKKQVESAIGMAPGQLLATGQTLLARLDERANAPKVAVKGLTVKHWGQNKEGWQVAETKHFRIFHRQDNEKAERLAMIAEETRATMYRKWFDADEVEWQPQCEVILHPSGTSYTQMTGVPANSPGHSRVESDPSGRIISRRVDVRLDIATMADAVLPHEATHVVLAGMFGNAPVPRWADEGIAVLSEPDEKIDLHRRNLLKHHKDGLLFGLKELMELKDYPHPRQIGAFYAQSVVLVEFLVQKGGPKKLTEFVKDGVRQGYDAALQRHYNMTFTQLDHAWQQQVISQSERVAAQK
jgi:tetratricopeptide (TPR) repeat protein